MTSCLYITSLEISFDFIKNLLQFFIRESLSLPVLNTVLNDLDQVLDDLLELLLHSFSTGIVKRP
ncbi:hypothetical protein C485_17957 [Natrinema altunense JCM 12890]|uniref:Uncharacterized protein n=1 Tax=Natrinema altunense (strain JCM 12890 / CGMCC 1.3731 / AJ2) TaxID=1227494 RepID=L9ZDJ3_NATA2|nr:hypothetical protein C485_17957 [Natrinema altunense JCM 12890]